jgi:putative ABC transport system permease protein
MIIGVNRQAKSSTLHRRVKKKKHSSLKQVFILSRDALTERKGRFALTILMVLVGGALMVTINGMSEGSAAFANKQLVSLAPNVIFVSPGSKSKTFQEAPGLATQAPRLPFNGQVVNTIKSLPYVKDVIPGYTAQVQLNVEGNIENTNVFATDATVAWQVAPTLTLVPGSTVQDNNPSAMLVGYNIANPPGYTHNPLIRVGQTITATYHGTSRHFLVTGVLNEAGNPNVDQVVLINTNVGNTFFHRLELYDQMIVLARSGSDVPTVIQEMNRVYGKDSFGIVSPAAIMQAQKHTQAGGASFTLEVGFIAKLVSAIGVVTRLANIISYNYLIILVITGLA